MRGPFMEEFGFITKESHMFVMEFPRMLAHMLGPASDTKKPGARQPGVLLRPGRARLDATDRGSPGKE